MSNIFNGSVIQMSPLWIPTVNHIFLIVCFGHKNVCVKAWQMPKWFLTFEKSTPRWELQWTSEKGPFEEQKHLETRAEIHQSVQSQFYLVFYWKSASQRTKF